MTDQLEQQLRADFRRRIVVQLPPGMGGAGFADKSNKANEKKASTESVKGGLPLIYNPEDNVSSGWVKYNSGLNGGRAQGTVEQAQGGSKKENGKVSDDSVLLSSKWMDRLSEDTDEMITDAIGHIRDVQTALVLGASKGVPISELPDRTAAEQAEKAALSGEPVKPMLMLRSVCSGIDPNITQMYGTMAQLVQESGMTQLSELLESKDKINDDNRPKAIFQAAGPPDPSAQQFHGSALTVTRRLHLRRPTRPPRRAVPWLIVTRRLHLFSPGGDRRARLWRHRGAGTRRFLLGEAPRRSCPVARQAARLRHRRLRAGVGTV